MNRNIEREGRKDIEGERRGPKGERGGEKQGGKEGRERGVERERERRGIKGVGKGERETKTQITPKPHSPTHSSC